MSLISKTQIYECFWAWKGSLSITVHRGNPFTSTPNTCFLQSWIFNIWSDKKIWIMTWSRESESEILRGVDCNLLYEISCNQSNHFSYLELYFSNRSTYFHRKPTQHEEYFWALKAHCFYFILPFSAFLLWSTFVINSFK